MPRHYNKRPDPKSLIGLPEHIIRAIVASAMGKESKAIAKMLDMSPVTICNILQGKKDLIRSVQDDPSQGIAALALLAAYDAIEKGLAAVKTLKTTKIVEDPSAFNALRNALAGFAAFKSPALVVKEEKKEKAVKKTGQAASARRNAQTPAQTSTILPDSGDIDPESGASPDADPSQVFES